MTSKKETREDLIKTLRTDIIIKLRHLPRFENDISPSQRVEIYDLLIELNAKLPMVYDSNGNPLIE